MHRRTATFYLCFLDADDYLADADILGKLYRRDFIEEHAIRFQNLAYAESVDVIEVMKPVYNFKAN